jgi:hypothetical protein
LIALVYFFAERCILNGQRLINVSQRKVLTNILRGADNGCRNTIGGIEVFGALVLIVLDYQPSAQ